MGPAVVGTLLITGAAALMAIPLGILGGIYLNEYGGKSPLARVIRFLAEVMTGVPSIVMGLFIYTFVVLQHQGEERLRRRARAGVPDAADRHPHHRPDALARAAASSARAATRSGAARRARSAPSCSRTRPPGIVSGALLAVARAAGETAPLLFTIGIVTRDQHEPVQRPEHRAVGADLPQRHVAVPGRSRTGRGARRSR